MATRSWAPQHSALSTQHSLRPAASHRGITRIEAVYPGDGNFTSSTSAPWTQTISQAGTTTTLPPSPGTLSNGVLTVQGTSGNDTFSFLTGSSQYVLNGVTYTFNPASVAVVNFQGNGGTDTAYITAAGNTATATLLPGSGQVRDSNDEVVLNSVSTIVVINGSGGNGSAYLSDTGGTKVFNGTPTSSWLDGQGILNEVIGFKAVHASAGPGSNDITYFADAGGSNVFNGTPTSSWLDGQAGNPPYLVKASGFQAVYATAAPGSNDIAYLADAGGTNTFNGTPTSSWLVGQGYLNNALGFQAVYATAGAGSNDTAFLTDNGGTNIYNGTPTNSWLVGQGFLNDVLGFQGRLCHRRRRQQ